MQTSFCSALPKSLLSYVLELSGSLQDAYLGQCALKPGHNQLGDAPTAARHISRHEYRQAEPE